MRSTANNAPLEGCRLSELPIVRLLVLVLRRPLEVGLTPKATELSLFLLSFVLVEGLALLAHHCLALLDQTGPINNLPIGRDIR